MDAEYETSIKRQDDIGLSRLTHSVPTDGKTRQSVLYLSIFVLVSHFFPKQIQIQVPTPCFSFISRRPTWGQAVVFLCVFFMRFITGENVFCKKVPIQA